MNSRFCGFLHIRKRGIWNGKREKHDFSDYDDAGFIIFYGSSSYYGYGIWNCGTESFAGAFYGPAGGK